MKTLYHGTAPQNVRGIIREGLKPGPTGYIYFCDSEKDCCVYSCLYNRNRHEIAIIPIEFTDEEIAGMKINLDNNPAFTPTAYAYDGTIDKTRIPFLMNIGKYVIG